VQHFLRQKQFGHHGDAHARDDRRDHEDEQSHGAIPAQVAESRGHAVVGAVGHRGPGPPEAERRDADAEEDGDRGIEQEGGARATDAADETGEQRPYGRAAHGGALEAAGGTHQRDITRQLGDGSGQPGLQDAVRHAEAEDEEHGRGH
jgi:hypothetical protein